MGRVQEAQRMLARYGSGLTTRPPDARILETTSVQISPGGESSSLATLRPLLGLAAALTATALAWGLVNFGVLLWLPGYLMATGRSVDLSSALIARSTLISI